MKFVIEEREGDIYVVLIVDDILLLDFKNKLAPNVRVRQGVVNIDKLLEAAVYWSSTDSRYGGPDGWIDFYNNCRKKAVYTQVLEIRKAIKRIEGTIKNMLIAHQAKKRLKD